MKKFIFLALLMSLLAAPISAQNNNPNPEKLSQGITRDGMIYKHASLKSRAKETKSLLFQKFVEEDARPLPKRSYIHKDGSVCPVFVTGGSRSSGHTIFAILPNGAIKTLSYTPGSTEPTLWQH